MGGPIFNQPVEGVDNGSTGYGVRGRSGRDNGVGVYGNTNRPNGVGVYGYSEEYEGDGVRGYSSLGNGVVGYGRNGIRGYSYVGQGVFGQCFYGFGVYGECTNSGNGVYGLSLNDDGVVGQSDSGSGVHGRSYSGIGGLFGESRNSDGVVGVNYSPLPTPVPPARAGVYGQSHYGHGVRAYSYENYALYASSYQGYAAYLKGEVTVDGQLIKRAGSFKIDHPLDPANKYLSHSFVESPDMKNVYDGVVTLDDKGEAEIELPDWFGALNKDFRYQLTAIGAPGPNLHIAEEISESFTNYSSNSNNKNSNSRFMIAGGTSGMKVSWQVTGIRQDTYAKAHPIQVEEDKPPKEQGYYLYPDLYGQPEEKGISHLLFPAKEKWQEVPVK